MFCEIELDMMEELSQLYIKAFHDASWDPDLAKTRIKEFVQHPQFWGCVLKENDRIISVAWGTFQQYYDGVRFFLTDLFTSTEHQNRGYGTQLLSYMKTVLKERGIKKIMLISADDALHNYFYDEKNGFFTRKEICLKQFNFE